MSGHKVVEQDVKRVDDGDEVNTERQVNRL